MLLFLKNYKNIPIKIQYQIKNIKHLIKIINNKKIKQTVYGETPLNGAQAVSGGRRKGVVVVEVVVTFGFSETIINKKNING